VITVKRRLGDRYTPFSDQCTPKNQCLAENDEENWFSANSMPESVTKTKVSGGGYKAGFPCVVSFAPV
jgi:hypothetical protein